MWCSLIQNAWKQAKSMHMALNLQMKTHPSSKTQNAHCHDIKQNLGAVSVFICVSPASTQDEEKDMCAFPGLDLGDATRFTKGLKGWGLLDKTILCWFHVRDNLCGGVIKRIIFTHYAKAITVIGGSYKISYATDKIEDSSGMESCG